MFLAPFSYSWAFSSLHHFSIPPILFHKVDPTWCTVLGKFQVALVWSSLRVLPWVQQYHFNFDSFFFLSNTGLSIVGAVPFYWVCNACRWFEITIIVSCDCVRIWDRVKFYAGEVRHCLLVFHCFTCKCFQLIHSIDLGICLLCIIWWRHIPMVRHYLLLADMIPPVELWEMVVEILPGF